MMPHRVPEDGQEAPSEEDAELGEGAGGKGVALNGIHILRGGNETRGVYPTHPLPTSLVNGTCLPPALL
jgi:hypothetical protein